MTKDTPSLEERIKQYLITDEWYKYVIDEAISELAKKIADLIFQEVEKAKKETAKAYGGCEKCYGKGYSTELTSETAFADFPGDKTVRTDISRMNFCSCDRGKQLEKLVS